MDLGFGKRPGAAPAAAGGGGDLVKETTTAAFKADVIDASKQALVLVDFWADWCGPASSSPRCSKRSCKSYGGKVRLVKLNVDQHPSIPGQLRIQSLPTVYAFRDGRPLDGFMGLQPESAIKAFIDRILGEDGAADIEAALGRSRQGARERRSAGRGRGLCAQSCRRTSRTSPRSPASRAAT